MVVNKLFFRIVIRWLANAFGLWLASRLLPGLVFNGGPVMFVVAGLLLSVINTLIKPLVIILSLPAIVLTLGLFIVFINGLMVAIAASLMDSLSVDGFGTAVLAGLIIGLVNYAVTTVIEEKRIHG